MDLVKIYPDAPIFTLVHNPKKTHWLPINKKIVTSFINKLPFSSKNPIIYTPIYDIALEQFDFSEFDIVISTTTILGHCLLTNSKTLFVCYFHNINRYLYSTPKQFKFLKPLLDIYKKIDFIYSKRPNFLFCNSKTVQARIKKHYNLESKPIHPGINLNKFYPSLNKKKIKPYFLVVSRLVPHKKIDLAIQACHFLNLRLIIIGTGRQKKELIQLKNKLKNKKIEFLGKVSNKKLLYLYQNCKALICSQLEDFGLTAIEAQACGKPVIGFNKGGNTETIINGKTGILFKKQNKESLIKALKKFNQKKFKKEDCINNAKRFSNKSFMINFKKSIDKLWKNHQIPQQTTTS